MSENFTKYFCLKALNILNQFLETSEAALDLPDGQAALTY